MGTNLSPQNQIQLELIAVKTVLEVLEELKLSTATQVDTAEITQIYLQRPAPLVGTPLGRWFAEAHGLDIKELTHCVSDMKTKLTIVQLGLNHLGLKPLMAYNKLYSKD